MTDDLDTGLSAALQLLEENAPEAIRSTAGVALPSRQDVARKTLKDTLAAAAEIGSHGSSLNKPVLRSLHHLACTGGTLISKAISAQPNVTLLSEVDPFSPIPFNTHFRPTDMIGLAKMGSRPASLEVQAKIFHASLKVLVQDNAAQGSHLVLRDHSHGKYTHGKDIAAYPGLYALIAPDYDLRSAVTVRNPIDSYLSIKTNKWDTFQPARFDEYCRRMLIFLDDHAHLPIIRYEDFATDPQMSCAALCDALALPFNPDFADLMSAFTLSGDSGRKGTQIQIRPRRPIPGDLVEDLSDSAHHKKLAERLGYSTALDAPQ